MSDRLSDYYETSEWLKAEDLDKNERIELTVDGIEIQLMENRSSGKKEEKAVVFFSGWPRKYHKLGDKGLVLNKTNGKVLTNAYGNSIQDNIGKPIVLFRTMTQFGADMVPCLRLDTDFQESTENEPPPAGPKEGDIPF